jgi:hypothetical protein
LFARQRRRVKYSVLGLVSVVVVYLTLVRPPLRSAAARWGVRSAMMSLLIYGSLIEPRWLRVARYDVVIEGLLPALNGLRVAHVTDFHVGAPGLTRWDFRRVIQCVEKFQPDLIALTGDFVARNGWNHLTLRDCLPLRARYGCFAVLGNSDQRCADEVSAELQALGSRVLSNRNALVVVGGETLAIVGVDNPAEGRDDLEAALRGLPHHVGLTLLLAHAPDVAGRLAHHDIDLILTGHTHGGQVRLPFLHRLVRKGMSRYRAGWFNVGKAKMFVNRGVGQVLPFRFLCPPEVALLTLKMVNG